MRKQKFIFLLLSLFFLILSGCKGASDSGSKEVPRPKVQDVPPSVTPTTSVPPLVTSPTGSPEITEDLAPSDPSVSSVPSTDSVSTVASGTFSSGEVHNQGVIKKSKTPPTGERDSKDFVCYFPESLKQAVEGALSKKCVDISSEEVAEIKALKIAYIEGEEGTKAKGGSQIPTKVLNSLEEGTEQTTAVVGDGLGDRMGSYFTSLESIDMSGEGFKAVPGFVFDFKDLKALNISHTKIQNLGPEFCKLQALTTLKASHNEYEGNEMPIAIVCLSELKNLDLSYSSLQYIDEYIYYLKKLESLNLSGNHLMNLPGMLAHLPSLITLDLTDNWFEYKSVNSLYDCSHFEKDSDDRKECQEEMLEDVQCEYWYEIPEDCSHISEEETEEKEKCERAKFKRGVLGNQSFIKRYEEMTGDEHAERHETDEGHLKARCYYFWINQYVFYNNPDDPKTDPEFEFLNLNYHNHPNKRLMVLEKLEKKQQYLLDLTINGKTIRELRLLLDEISKNSGKILSLSLGRYTGCQFHLKGMSFRNTKEVIKEDWNIKTAFYNTLRVLGNGWLDFWSFLYHFWIWPQNTSYGPSHHETHIERHRSPNWNERPLKNKKELCSPIDYSTPIPQGPLGPWSKALPAVQALVKEKYLEPKWNQCENWPVGQCYDWEARMERGDNPGGFKKEYFAKKVEERNKQRRIEREKERARARANLEESNNGKPH